MVQLLTPRLECAQRRPEALCSACGARAWSVCKSLGTSELEQLDAIAERIAVAPGESLAREGEAAAYVFNLTSGSVRLYKLMPDGRRQITGFLFAGDFIGLACGDTYAFSAETMEPTALCRFRTAEYRRLARGTPSLESALLERAAHELTQAHDQMLLLGRKSALERLASFLLQQLERDPIRKLEPGRMRLPMTRSEIADYLGLTIETVSRTLTRLKTLGIVQLPAMNEIQIQQPGRLAALANGEN